MDKKLIIAALRGLPYAAEFSAQDTNTAAIKEILQEAGVPENCSTRTLIEKKATIFAIIAEQIDEILPKEITNIMGAYAEVKSYARDEQPIFHIKTGQRRARLSIKKGARGGLYRAAQFDNKLMELQTEVYTVGEYVSLEDMLLGRVSLAEYYANLVIGFEERIYEETVAALRTAEQLAPASHTESASSATAGAIETALDKVIRIAKAYGDGVTIFGFSTLISKLLNVSDWKVDEDKTDIRTLGHIRVYKGVPIVELPNYILKDGASGAMQWAFKENELFVLPGAAQPVKIAMRGESVITDDKEPTGSEVWNCHKMFGVGLLLADNVCIVKDTTEDTNGVF